MWRHGDVLIAAISKIPTNATPRPGTILAYGEITGHSHRLQNPAPMNAATAFLARRLIKLKYVTLVNILLDRPVMPELLLEDCRPDKLAGALQRLLDDPSAREAQRQGMAEALSRLGYGQDSPSLRAADAVLAVIDEMERRRA